MGIWLSALALILLGSLFLFLSAWLQRRPQLPGLIFSVLTLAAYLGYYGDRSPFRDIHSRDVLEPFGILPRASTSFASVAIVSYFLAAIYLVRVIIYQRVAIRRRIAHIIDPIANFAAGATFAILLGAIVDSLYHWGWVGAVVIALILAAIYLGIIGLFEGIVAVSEELISYLQIRLKRMLSKIAIKIAEVASYIASLSQRLVPDFKYVAERLREKAEMQRQEYDRQVAEEDAELEARHTRNQARQHQRRRS
jgi:hypothetical protein